MSDYIKREDAVFTMCFAMCGHKPCEERSFCQIAKSMDNIPAADVRGNVRGEWVTKQRHEHYPSCKPYEADYCSVCGKRGNAEYELCPNCGADMRDQAKEVGS